MPRTYDAVVVGSGFGGSFAAFTLASAGLKTLLVERGGWARRDSLDQDPEEMLVRHRYRRECPIIVDQSDKDEPTLVYPAAVVGGGSVFYAGASLRFRESDFDGWPVGYDGFEPDYCRAEELLEVHGDDCEDPSRPPRSRDFPFKPPDLTPPAQLLDRAARELGYSPFKIPLALNFGNQSRMACGRCNRCDGYPCPTFSKNDLPTVLLPEAQKAGLDLQTNSVVGRLTFAGSKVSGVSGIDRRTGQPFEIPAGLVVLSAGAVDSPAILLRSRLNHGTDRPWLGRGLMRHCFAAVTGFFPSAPNPTDVFHKQVCVTVRDDTRSAGPFRHIGIIQNVWSPPRELCRQVIPSPFKTLAAATSGHLLTLICIAQDEPNPDNCVTLGPELDRCGLEVAKVTHRFSPRDLDCRRVLVEMASRILRRAGALACHVYPVTTFTHAVGTLRFGSDPASSALDPDCRVWGIDNLFVVDGSFMPTSGSVNPSLTIAANALRAGRTIAATIRGL